MGKFGDLMVSGTYGRPLREPLVKLVEEGADTPYARFAAWQLARTLAEEAKDKDAEGLQRMAGYLELAIRDPLKDIITEESLRLLLSAYTELRQMSKASACAELYMRLFPKGRYASDMAEWQKRNVR
jgi:hypothetical protein